MNARPLLSACLLALIMSSCSATDDPPNPTGSAGSSAPVVASSDPATDPTPVDDAATFESWLADNPNPTAEQLLGVTAGAFAGTGSFDGFDGVEPIALVNEFGSYTDLFEQVQSRWAEFTPQQQQQLFDLIAPDVEPVLVTADGVQAQAQAQVQALGGGVGRQASANGPSIDDAEAVALIERAVADIESRLGYRYGTSITVLVVDTLRAEDDDTRPIDEATWAYATPNSLDAASRVIENMLRTGNEPTRELNCNIVVGQIIGQVSEAVAYEKLAHEVFHCFQRRFFTGSWSEFEALAEWQIEGSAAWVGLTLSGGAANAHSRGWWRTYLAGNTGGGGSYALSGATYSAHGLFAYLDGEHGVGMWPLVLEQINAGSPEQAFVRLTGDDPAILGGWAAATSRQTFSAAWDMDGPAITADVRSPAGGPLAVGDSLQTSAGPMTNLLATVEFAAETPYATVQVDGVALGTWSGESDFDLSDQVVRYCFADECVCPDGRPPWNGAPYIAREPDPALWVSLAGASASGTALAVFAQSVDDACVPCDQASSGEPGGSPEPGSVEPGDGCGDPCILGKWQLTPESAAAQLEALGAGIPVADATVTGTLVLEFADGVMSGSYNDLTFDVTFGEPPALTTQVISGGFTTSYEGTPGILRVGGVSSEITQTVTFTVDGVTSPPSTIAFRVWDDVQSATYTCFENSLTLTADTFPVTLAFTRITPPT